MNPDPGALQALFDEMVALRDEADGAEERYRELAGRLDDYFWERSHQAVAAAVALAVGGGRLDFSPAERLMLDTGLIDLRLVHRAGPDFLERLSAETQRPGPEGVCHLSEWLGERFSSFLAARGPSGGRESASAVLRSAAGDDPELVKARQKRGEAYRRLEDLFAGLPGVRPELAGALASGAVDDRIEGLLLSQAAADHRAGEGGAAADQSAGEQARRFENVVLKVLRQARQHARTAEDRRLLEALSGLRLAVFRACLARARQVLAGAAAPARGPEEGPGVPDPARAEAGEFLGRELRALRALLGIGSHEGQVDFPCSVLLNDVPRTTREGVGAALDLVREVDPRIDLGHDVLIAPFTGGGLFDWDRDLLIVALTPARSAEEAVVHAVANFRLLADVRGKGEIEKAYREAHGANFRQQFLADYRNWVLRVGRGKREALSAKGYEFFVERIGPPPAGPLVPNELAGLDVDARNAETERLSKLALAQSPGPAPADIYRLAVLLWEQERIEDAIRTMEKAVQAAPDDGRALYALGLLCRKRRLVGAARKAFRNATRAAPDSLWGVYAHEALRRMV